MQRHQFVDYRQDRLSARPAEPPVAAILVNRSTHGCSYDKSSLLVEIRQHPRHLASRRAHPSAGETADLPRALFRDPLSDSGRLDKPDFVDSKWPRAFAYLDHEVGHRRRARLLAISGVLRRQPLDPDDQPRVRQYDAAAQDRAIVRIPKG
jgi:hypothetical protein